MYLWCLNQGSWVGDPTACEKVWLPCVWCLMSSAALWGVSPQADGFCHGLNFRSTEIVSALSGFWTLCGLPEIPYYLLVVLDLEESCGWLCALVPVPCRKPIWYPVTSAEIPVSHHFNTFVTNTEYFNNHISREINQPTNQNKPKIKYCLIINK